MCTFPRYQSPKLTRQLVYDCIAKCSFPMKYAPPYPALCWINHIVRTYLMKRLLVLRTHDVYARGIAHWTVRCQHSKRLHGTLHTRCPNTTRTVCGPCAYKMFNQTTHNVPQDVLQIGSSRSEAVQDGSGGVLEYVCKISETQHFVQRVSNMPTCRALMSESCSVSFPCSQPDILLHMVSI